MPQKQGDDERRGPRINVVKVAGAPMLGHSNEDRHRIKNNGDDGEREKTDAEAVPGFLDIHVDADAADHGEQGERVSLPAQIVESEAAVDGGKRESEERPERG